MQAHEIAVCTMEIFDDRHNHLWISDMNEILEKNPILTYPHRNDFISILLVEKADIEIVIDNHRIHIDNSGIIVIPPKNINSISINRNTIGVMICFTKDYYVLRNNNILHQINFLATKNQSFIGISEQQTNHLFKLVNLVNEEFITQRKHSEHIVHSYLNVFLYEVERLYKPKPYEKSLHNHKTEKIRQFELLIEKHYRAKKAPSEYAKLLHVTTNYLNKLCKETIGITSSQLIRKQLTVEAKRLLHYSMDSINQIADKMGFDSASCFITFFKKSTKLTPEQYRREKYKI